MLVMVYFSKKLSWKKSKKHKNLTLVKIIWGVFPPSTPGCCFSSQKGALYGASGESRVGIATLKEPVTQNWRERTGKPTFERDRYIFKKAR